jgi:hypothetical protein
MAWLTDEISWFTLPRVRSLGCCLLGGLSLVIMACGSSSSDGSGGAAGVGAAGSAAGSSQGGVAAGGAASGGTPSAGAAGERAGGAGATQAGSGGEASTNGGNGAESGAGGGETGDLPDLPADTKVKMLDDAQRGVLCDWYASKLGGYGHETECLTGSVKVYDTKAQCVEVGLRYDCPLVTVAQVAECTLGQVPSGGCVRPGEQCHWLDCM